MSSIKKSTTGKKSRIKIPQENKIRAELQREISSSCPFCEGQEVGHFEIHHIDENPANNDKINLLLLCPTCHSKITKGDISKDEVYKIKLSLLSKQLPKTLNTSKVNNNSFKNVNQAIVGDNNSIVINHQQKTVKAKYPPGCIGYDTLKANYIGHLIKRFNEYKEYEVGKVNYAVFAGSLKKQFSIPPTRTIYNIPIEKFEELVSYIQLRIDGTKLARIKGKSHKNYSSFSEYQQK
jgi:hypothetical protein